MKVFVGLVLAVIAVGLVLVVAAMAFLFGFSESVEVTESDAVGVTGMNAFPRTDLVAIEVQWTVSDPESTYVLQRTTDPDADDWVEVFTLEPGSDAYTDDYSAVYVDDDVERLQTYFYRFYFTIPGGGEGYTSHIAVTPT